MKILLNDLLNLTEKQLENSKIELNMTAGKASDGSEVFIDRWLKTDQGKKEQGLTDCSYWGWYGEKRNFYPGQWVFSFIKLDYDEWMLISAAEIIDIPQKSRANVKILEQYKPYFGRLIIKYKKGNTYSRYVFRLKNLINECEVKEILPAIFTGFDFPGYDNVSLTYEQLKTIVDGNYPSYHNALRNQKAVYLQTDKATGKMYVGSATAEKGMLLARWSSYVHNGHGGNEGLIELIKEKGFDYIKENFQYTILENYNSKVDDEYVLKRESYWKEVFQSRKFGYNKN